MQCYQGAGTVADGTLKLMDCAAGDRCVNVTTSGVLAWSCNTETALTALGSKDNECTEVLTIKTCVCKTDGCNSAPTQATIPAMILVAVTTMMKLVIT